MCYSIVTEAPANQQDMQKLFNDDDKCGCVSCLLVFRGREIHWLRQHGEIIPQCPYCHKREIEQLPK